MKKSWLAVLMIIGIECFFLTPSLSAQPKKGLYGISINLMSGLLVSDNISLPAVPYTIGLAYLPSDHIRLRADIGFRSQKDTTGISQSEFAFTANIWNYLSTTDNVSPFLGGSITFGSQTDRNANGTSLFGAGLFGGAEYWISTHFSVYGQIGAEYSSSSLSGKTATDIYTTASTGFCWYF